MLVQGSELLLSVPSLRSPQHGRGPCHADERVSALGWGGGARPHSLSSQASPFPRFALPPLPSPPAQLTDQSLPFPCDGLKMKSCSLRVRLQHHNWKYPAA